MEVEESQKKLGISLRKPSFPRKPLTILTLNPHPQLKLFQREGGRASQRRDGLNMCAFSIDRRHATELALALVGLKADFSDGICTTPSLLPGTSTGLFWDTEKETLGFFPSYAAMH